MKAIEGVLKLTASETDSPCPRNNLPSCMPALLRVGAGVSFVNLHLPITVTIWDFFQESDDNLCIFPTRED